MSQEVGALTLLGESADWLKDRNGDSIRDRRLAAVEAFRSAWSDPADDARFQSMEGAFNALIEALQHNHLYPDGIVLSRSDAPKPRYLPAAASLRKDVDELKNFCVVNKFGIGEIHMLYLSQVLCRMLYMPARAAFDAVVENSVADILLLRVPIYRADNLGAFSYEARARFHAVRILKSMTKLGLFRGAPPGEFGVLDEAEVRQLLADELRGAAGRYIQRVNRLPFHILDKATALEEFARAHAAGQAASDERTPEELFLRLKHWMKKIPDESDLPDNEKQRLINLGVASMVRSMSHVEPVLARDIYSFLRGSRFKPSVRHSRMFELLPNSSEKLRLVNVLYGMGKQNPVYYLEHFQRHFPGEKLRFVHKDVGFALESEQKTA